MTGSTTPRRHLPAWSMPRSNIDSLPPGLPAAAVTPEWAWGGSTGSAVSVCVIDSGVDPTHPMVGGVTRSAVAVPGSGGGYRIEEAPSIDVVGHGTACASVVRRVAPDCEIWSVRVLLAGGSGDGEALLAGLAWAVEAGADVINMSLSTQRAQFRSALQSTTDQAFFARSVIVASAHNRPVVSFPWSFASVISVGSHSDPDPETFYANPSAPPEFFSPGLNVPTAWLGGKEVTVTGNSFAAPHISGRCALILSKHRDLYPYHVKSILHHTATNVRKAGP